MAEADKSAKIPGTGPLARWNGRVSIAITLATAIGLLVAVAAGGVLAVGVWLAHKNTFALLSASAHQSISAAANRIRQHLDPAARQAEFIAGLIETGAANPGDRETFGKLLTGALAAAPQVDAVMFVDTRYRAFLAGRDRRRDRVVLVGIDYSGDPAIRAALRAAREEPKWGPPVWRKNRGKTFLNHAHPVIHDGTYVGAVVSVVSVQELSDFIGAAEFESAGRRFVLYGSDRVLAHPLMIDGYPGRSREAPLPALADFGDSVLAAIWRRDGRQKLAFELPAGTEGHMLKVHNDEYVFLYQSMTGYGPLPLTVGIYFRAAEVGREIRRIVLGLGVGLAGLLVALIAAVVLGRHIARPIVRFSAAAGRIRDLDIAKVEALPGSLFRELNDQARAFNAMLRALRWFELYVPRKLVERLIRRGDAGEAVSDAREVTVMFTDIAGFSAMAETMEAAEVAAFLNRHFAMIAGSVEAEEGTVDKFMGDALMAFWGAPEPQPDSAERACRAALAIADAIRADNARRAERGEATVRIRIGIHSGSVTVGNIGAPNRLNYTIVGETVNVGQRLEQMGKELYPPGTEVAILISGDTAGQLGPAFRPEPAGRHRLRGHAGETEVFRLA